MTFLREAEASLSQARLSAYRIGPEDANEVVLGRYLWNIALAESLYPTIHLLEVALRNSFHGAIAMVAGPEWFDQPAVVVNARTRDEIFQVKQRIREAGHAVAVPRVIAGLDLGFWSGLCSRLYEQGPAMPPSQIPLWPVVMRHLGPLLPRSLRTRASLSEFLGRVRIIRNRAYHHEPLWAGHRDRRGQMVPLSFDHAQMQLLVDALSPRSAALMRLADRFGDVFDAGPGPWTAAVRELCEAEGVIP